MLGNLLRVIWLVYSNGKDRSDSRAHALLLFQCYLLKAVKKEGRGGYTGLSVCA